MDKAPKMSESTRIREAYFTEFVERVQEVYSSIPIQLSGGFLPDDQAFAQSHMVKGEWFASIIPVKVVGSGLALQFFYHNMRRIGHGLKSDPNVSIPSMVFKDIIETFRSGLLQTVERMLQGFP